MIVKVEPTGCSTRKGMVRIRLSMYLEPGEYGYDKHYVYVDESWQNNPFHNHFIYAEPDTPDDDIMEWAEKLCKEYYKIWEKEEKMYIKNKKITFPSITPERLAACDAKVKHLKETLLEKKVKE